LFSSYLRGFVVGPNPNAPNPNLPGTFLSSTTPGTVINNGSISAPQGNINRRRHHQRQRHPDLDDVDDR
jgi:hypothetical protein